MEGEDDLDRFMEADQQQTDSIWRTLRTVLLLPLLFTNLAVKVTLWITVSFILGPLIALMWRTRRYLADATAVQLTRYPDGLARALERLADKRTRVPGSLGEPSVVLPSAAAPSETPSLARRRNFSG